MAYNDLVNNITKAVENKFSEISTRYNFDNGDEFEIALCELFKLILPNKYGICRGFAVTKENQSAGDDLIIYDRGRFPTLRLLEEGKFDKKYEIPFEAIFAYIEAKNTLIFEGKTANFEKALEQVSNFKKLPRKERKILSIDHHINLGDFFETVHRPKWPNIANPVFTAIISRNIQMPKQMNDIDLIRFVLNNMNKFLDINKYPDMVISGNDFIFIPEITDDEQNQNDSPFVSDQNKLKGYYISNNSFGIGIINVLYAIDNIRLGEFPYSKIIYNRLNR